MLYDGLMTDVCSLYDSLSRVPPPRKVFAEVGRLCVIRVPRSTCAAWTCCPEEGAPHDGLLITVATGGPVCALFGSRASGHRPGSRCACEKYGAEGGSGAGGSGVGRALEGCGDKYGDGGGDPDRDL